MIEQFLNVLVRIAVALETIAASKGDGTDTPPADRRETKGKSNKPPKQEEPTGDDAGDGADGSGDDAGDELGGDDAGGGDEKSLADKQAELLGILKEIVKKKGANGKALAKGVLKKFELEKSTDTDESNIDEVLKFAHKVLK